eukprot:6663873-Prymnesium_polylepis.1
MGSAQRSDKSTGARRRRPCARKYTKHARVHANKADSHTASAHASATPPNLGGRAACRETRPWKPCAVAAARLS